MRPEDRFLFLATRQKMDAQTCNRLEEASRRHTLAWERIYTVADRDGVAPLIYQNIMTSPTLVSCIPDTVLHQFKAQAVRNIIQKQERAVFLRKALEYLHSKDIDVIVLKGASLDQLIYDEPWFTVYSDIDLILSCRNTDLSEHQVEELGHWFYRQHVEYEFFEHHDFNMNGLLPIDFADVWKTARSVDFSGTQALVLSPEYQLLSICINSCRKRFFRLKALLDIVETIRNTAELDWERFTSLCRQANCGSIVYTALRVAMDTLGCPVPKKVFSAMGISLARRAVIRLNIAFLMTFWSISSQLPRLRIFNRLIDLRLILPYAAYQPNQILRKSHEIRTMSKLQK